MIKLLSSRRAQLGFKIGTILSLVAAAYFVGKRDPRDTRAPGAPQSNFIGFHPSVTDLGDREWGKTIAFTLTFVNNSDHPLTLQSASSSCGCTVVDQTAIAGRAVEARSTFDIPVSLDTQRTPGPKSRRVEVITAAGERFATAIELNVLGTWSYHPDVIDFGEIAVGSDPSPIIRRIDFESDVDALQAISQPRVPWLRATMASSDAKKASVEVRLVPALLSAGVNSASLTLSTSNKTKPDGQVYIRARAAYPLMPSQPMVVLAADQPRRIRFLDRSGAPPNLTKIVCPSPELTTTLVEPGELEIRATGSAPFSTHVSVSDELGRFGRVDVSAF